MSSHANVNARDAVAVPPPFGNGERTPEPGCDGDLNLSGRVAAPPDWLVAGRTVAPDRKSGLITGVLFIIGTVAILVGTAIEQPVQQDADWLSRLSADANRVALGGLLELVAAGASAGIAIAMYPVLEQWSVGRALGAVAFRTMEAVMYAVAAVVLLAFLATGHQFTTASSVDRTVFQAIGDSLLAVRKDAVLAGVFAFSTGALMYSPSSISSGSFPVGCQAGGLPRCC
jgi:hypothetical protein